MTLSLETISGGTSSQTNAPVVDPALAQLFAALLAGAPALDTPEITPDNADSVEGEADAPKTGEQDVAALTGNFLPLVGNTMPQEAPKPVEQTVSVASKAPDVVLTRGTQAPPVQPAQASETDGRAAPLAPLPSGFAGFEWAKMVVSQTASAGEGGGANVSKTNAPGLTNELSKADRSAAPDIASGDINRLAQLRGETQPAVVRHVVGQTTVAQQAVATASGPIAPVDPELGENSKGEARTHIRTEQLAAAEPALRTFAQASVVPVDHGARPVVEAAPSTHSHFDLTKQIDKAVAALDAMPGDTVERSAKLTIPHDRLGTMALHLSRDDDGGIGLRADTMPQDIRMHLAEGAAQAERRFATAPQPSHQGSLGGGQLGENTQGRGSNGEPRSSLEDRSGSQRENTSARRDGQSDAQPRGRRQAPRDGSIFA
ncbi:hypothetical protein GRI58_02280 [Porphyrobacter algicida]|uniref:Uncharacterized protein n=1 Tax=Qipengyuania algicida TaxID=1836209 RepID=A0A845AKS9_9SPHN|nr:hypothetical protein [Qipengyuania algicida]MXP27648.1 hypothetical protein [Qipengyuania algicida]